MFNLLLVVIYLSFISLGLPDSLLGSAWPTMYPQLNVPISYAGIISMIISFGTIISSLQSDRLTKQFGSGLVTAISVAMTAFALLGFSMSSSFWMLCLMAIPYGLGAGSVDASINNYAAIHFESKHMSWLHCMWGVGASVGPYIMSFAITNHLGWSKGYLIISILQMILTGIILFSLPLWKNSVSNNNENLNNKPLTLKEILSIVGTKEIMLTFFCYCALESTAGLWASSYLVFQNGISEEIAASFASLFYLGMTIGRAGNGFLTIKFNDTQLIRMGQGGILLGILIVLFSFHDFMSLVGLIVIGIGCAPIYPCIIHSTPSRFGVDKSQAIIGVQMASAYMGTLFMPPLFGIIAQYSSVGLYPIYMSIILVIMITMHERLIKITK